MSEWLSTLENTGFSTWLRESGSIWAYPLVLTLHTTGMGVLVGMNWALDLRVLGVATAIPLASLRNLFTAMWVGFWINLVTGLMLFAADATTKGSTRLFLFKLLLIVVAVIAAVAMKRSIYGRQEASAPVAPSAKAYAVLSLVLWVAALTAGRMMAYV